MDHDPMPGENGSEVRVTGPIGAQMLLPSLRRCGGSYGA